jgi:hypothetical protein
MLDVVGDVNINSDYQIGGVAVLSVAGDENTFVGEGAGISNTTGFANTFVGLNTGYSNTLGSANTFVGRTAGFACSSGVSNTCVGQRAGAKNVQGSYNTIIGRAAGYNATGSGNVFIGHEAGYSETSDEQLYIANGSSGSDVLIRGSFLTGDVGLPNLPVGTGTDVVINASGWLKVKSSSRRYKENIRELQIEQEKVLQLEPVRFDWKTTGEKDIGLIAEDVERILPDLVIYDKEGKPDAVKYDMVALHLLAVIKELKAENAALKAHQAKTDVQLSQLTELVETILAAQNQSKSGDDKLTLNR